MQIKQFDQQEHFFHKNFHELFNMNRTDKDDENDENENDENNKNNKNDENKQENIDASTNWIHAKFVKF